MSCTIHSAALVGIEAEPVEVETDVSNGLPAFTIVGLPDASVQEARERVRSAFKHSGLAFPKTRLTVNLAPADLRKEGPAFDLPMAAAIMAATGELPVEKLRGAMALGELALDGAVRPVSGVLAAALAARRRGFHALYVPEGNAAEAALVPDLAVFPVATLRALFEHLTERAPLTAAPPSEAAGPDETPGDLDFASIAGLANAKRALEIAAAGAHNILLNGAPGAGKTLLARALPSILPPMTREEALEVTTIYGVARLSARAGLITRRPWRAPHHTASAPAVIGGGANPHPGEVTLAHRGVLFLDELPEFPRTVLESLRQPLEDREVTVSRASGTLRFPSSFTLVAARNPCPCGYAGDPERACTCPAASLERYAKRLSGPLLDRIDLHVDVPRTPYAELSRAHAAESSAVVRTRVVAARRRQAERLAPHALSCNAEIPSRLIKSLCPVSEETDALLEKAAAALKLSARSIHRCLKIARTIADLGGRARIETSDVAEALRYRPRME